MNIGAKAGLVDPRHEERMGTALWLFLWFLLRQTKSDGSVLGGMPLTYRDISTRSGFTERKVRRWMNTLRSEQYILVKYRNFKMMAIWVCNPKKFDFKQGRLPLTGNGQSLPSKPLTENGQSYPQKPLTENGQSIRPKTVNGLTKNGQSKQSGSMSYIESTTTPPLPPTSVGGPPEQLISWARQTVAVQMGRRRRLPNLEAMVGARADDVAQFLTRKGFPARVVPDAGNSIENREARHG